MSYAEEPAPTGTRTIDQDTSNNPDTERTERRDRVSSDAQLPAGSSADATRIRDAAPGAAANPETDRTERRDRAPSDGQLPPGASADDPVAALWGADLVQRYRGRWQELQLRFVDDPHAATEQAAHLVDEAVDSLTGALTDQKRSLDGWQRQGRDDTEELRNALQRYRGFLDRLLGM
jgi:hypothetical protein